MKSSRPICIVDDDPDYRFLVQQLFSRILSAYPVRFFPEGQTFLDQLDQMSHKPDLILLDRHMPKLDGYQTLLVLRQHPGYQTIPVVMMSAHDSWAEIEACFQAGVNAFLVKRYDINLLGQALTSLCQYCLELNQKASPDDWLKSK